MPNRKKAAEVAEAAEAAPVTPKKTRRSDDEHYEFNAIKLFEQRRDEKRSRVIKDLSNNSNRKLSFQS